MTTADVAAPARQPLPWREAGALFAAVVLVGIAWVAPVAGRTVPRGAGGAGELLPSDAVNVALRSAAVELSAVDASAAQAAVANASTDNAVTLVLARGGAAPCVEATHLAAAGQVWSYDAATGAIATQPC